jgi:hypothetical protein
MQRLSSMAHVNAGSNGPVAGPETPDTAENQPPNAVDPLPQPLTITIQASVRQCPRLCFKVPEHKDQGVGCCAGLCIIPVYNLSALVLDKSNIHCNGACCCPPLQVWVHDRTAPAQSYHKRKWQRMRVTGTDDAGPPDAYCMTAAVGVAAAKDSRRMSLSTSGVLNRQAHSVQQPTPLCANCWHADAARVGRNKTTQP